MPAHLINGIGVSLGISLIFVVVSLLGGPSAAVAASSGAVYASLADVPNSPERTWRRVLTAVLIGCSVSGLLMPLRTHPIAIGAAVALVGFLSTLTLAWGPRAGPISFVGLLSFVFTMAAPPIATATGIALALAWISLGSALYLAWAAFTSSCLQVRYRALALGAVFGATADLLRARARLMGNNHRIAAAALTATN